VGQLVVMVVQYMLRVLKTGGMPGGVDEVYKIIACGCQVFQAYTGALFLPYSVACSAVIPFNA
jgi:hypothetical protein